MRTIKQANRAAGPLRPGDGRACGHENREARRADEASLLRDAAGGLCVALGKSSPRRRGSPATFVKGA